MTWLIGKLKTNLRLIILTCEQIKKYKIHGSELIDGEKIYVCS